MLVAVIICGVAILGVGLVVFFGTAETDEARVARYLTAQGGVLGRMAPVSVSGEPFGFPKIGRRGGHVYTINYLDQEDRYHFAKCETNAAIGVILRRDGIREENREAD